MSLNLLSTLLQETSFGSFTRTSQSASSLASRIYALSNNATNTTAAIQQSLSSISSTATSTTTSLQNTLSQMAASSTAQLSSTISTSTSSANVLKSTLSTAQSSIVAQRIVAEISILSANKAVLGIQESIESIAALASFTTEQAGLDEIYFASVSGADDSTAFTSESSSAYSTTTGIFPQQESSRAVFDASTISTATSTLTNNGIANTVNPITSEVSRANSSATAQVAAAGITSGFSKLTGTTQDNAAW